MRGLLLLSSASFLTSASLIFVALILLHMYLACTNHSTYEMLKRESFCEPVCAPLHLQRHDKPSVIAAAFTAYRAML